MKTLMILRGNGERYEIAESGFITRPGVWTGSPKWQFLGFSTHHMHNHVTLTLAHIFAHPECLKVSRLYGYDLDHGTVRGWRSPDVQRAWIETSPTGGK